MSTLRSALLAAVVALTLQSGPSADLGCQLDPHGGCHAGLDAGSAMDPNGGDTNG